MVEKIFAIIACHLLGDYVLQTDFIAKTKSNNWYHMFAHCVLYCVPFYVAFGFDWRLMVIFLTHIVIDPLKAKWCRITYVQDQVLHYVIAALLYLCI